MSKTRGEMEGKEVDIKIKGLERIGVRNRQFLKDKILSFKVHLPQKMMLKLAPVTYSLTFPSNCNRNSIF